MFILNSHEQIAAMQICDRIIDYGCGGYSPRRRSEPPKKAVTDGDNTQLRSGFNAHSVKLPDGGKIEIHEDGQIIMTEADGQTRKLRHKNTLEQNVIK